MKNSRYFSSILLLAIVLTGCATSINRKTSSIYLNKAVIAQQNDNWRLARQYYGKSLVNAELENSDKRQLAALNYEYGRASGVICDYENAEKYLLKALDLDQQVSGTVHMSLVELARLNYDQKKYIKSVSYYARAIPVFDELNASSHDPIGVVDVLSEYVNALNMIGRRHEADTIQKRLTNLSDSNKDKTLKTDCTPYGSQCHIQPVHQGQGGHIWTPPRSQAEKISCIN